MQDFEELAEIIMSRRPDDFMFVETGTGTGETAFWASVHFKHVITVELMDDLYQGVTHRIWDRGIPNITLLHGDAGEWVRDIAYRLYGPATWWLDAHDVNRVDGKRPPKESTIAEELRQILPYPHDHLVLIDDARLFGAGGYPTTQWVKDTATLHGYRFEQVGDIFVLQR